QEDLTVGDRDHVGRNERSDVVGLGFDDRQTGHRTAAELIGELRAAFEQTRVQVEHIARVGLTARRTTQEQRHGAVGFGLLRQIVEDDEDVLAVIHPVLTDSRAGVGSEVLVPGRIRRRRGHDGRVFESSCLFQRTAHTGDGRALLADSDVDAADLLLRVAGLPVGLLVDDRVDRQSGLAGLAVTDDQLTLSTADRNHRVDALVAGLEGLAHLLPVHHAGGLELELTATDGLDVAESVDGTTQRIDDATEISIADRNRQDLAGAVDVLFFSDRGELAEDDDADLPFLEVLRQPQSAVFEPQELVGHGAGQARYVGNPVTSGDDLADLGLLRALGVVRLYELPESVPNLFRASCQFRHLVSLLPFLNSCVRRPVGRL